MSLVEVKCEGSALRVTSRSGLREYARPKGRHLLLVRSEGKKFRGQVGGCR